MIGNPKLVLLDEPLEAMDFDAASAARAVLLSCLLG
jgi:ABC-type sulfate/molybdate transport systems ATPase subunit